MINKEIRREFLRSLISKQFIDVAFIEKEQIVEKIQLTNTFMHAYHNLYKSSEEGGDGGAGGLEGMAISKRRR